MCYEHGVFNDVFRMKSLLFVLVRAFEFELAVSPEEIVKSAAVLNRPTLASDPDKGNQLPVYLRPYERKE
jgi:hypothetical protein